MTGVAASIPIIRLMMLALVVLTLLFPLVTCSPPVSALSQVRALGELRVAMVNSPISYYEGVSGPTGYEYELIADLAERLGVELSLEIRSSPSEALDTLRAGDAHLAAAGIAITPSRSAAFRFSRPILEVVLSLVYKRGTLRPPDISDLEPGLVVPQASAAAEHLALLRETHPELRWTEVDDLEYEDLLVKVANGEIRYTVAPSNLIAMNQRHFPALRVAFELTDPQSVAWAFPASFDNSLLYETQHYLTGKSEVEFDQLRDRYFGHVKQVDYVSAYRFAQHVQSRLPKYRQYFEEAGKEYGLDWRFLAAIGYQESHWRRNAVSPTGVRGIMMLTRQTAKFLGVKNRKDPRESIFGGARYINRMRGLLPERVAEPDRSFLALAAYNMGYGHLIDARQLVRERGGDPGRWVDVRAVLPLLSKPRYFKRLKSGYARGYEAETYVGNVRTYYDMLQFSFPDPITQSSEATPVEPKPEREPPEIPEETLNIRTPVI